MGMNDQKLEFAIMGLLEQADKNNISEADMYYMGKELHGVIYNPREIGCYFLSHRKPNLAIEKIKEEYYDPEQEKS